MIAALRERGLLVEAGRITHRYPICWRCRTPLVFRVVDDWFIGVDEVREQLLAENQNGRVDAAAVRQADGRLAPQHGRLEHLAEALLRPAAALLPLPVRAPERGRLARGARGARDRRARAAAGAPPAVDRRGQDPLRVVRGRGRARPRGRRRLARRRDRPALDARLGVAEVRARRLRDGRGQGADRRRPARPRVLGAVVPGRLDLRDARADPALVLLAVLHVGDARRPLAVPARAHLREAPRRDRPRDAPLVGQLDRRERGVRPDGRRRDALALLRRQSRAEPEVRLRPRRRGEAAAAHALELGLVLRHLREHRGLPAVVRRPRRRAAGGRSRSTPGSSRGRRSSSPR